MKLRLFAKQDILVCENYLKTGEEVRLGKISDSGKLVMLIDKEDNLHKWVEIDKLHELIEERMVEE